jgi:hypothetical protein
MLWQQAHQFSPMQDRSAGKELRLQTKELIEEEELAIEDVAKLDQLTK